VRSTAHVYHPVRAGSRPGRGLRRFELGDQLVDLSALVGADGEAHEGAHDHQYLEELLLVAEERALAA